MKNYKKTIMILLTVAVLLIAIFAAGRYGWKLLGFRACEDAGVESVEVIETAVRIKGFYPGSFPEGFCGYYAEEQEGTLYVGFNFSAVFGFFETGDFEVSIPTKNEICEVVLKTELSERTIWTVETGAASDSPPQWRMRPPNSMHSVCISNWNAVMPALSPCTVAALQKYVKTQTAHC